ncbi:MAG TPA: translocation protein TolB, partial [Verrucomicrobiae bacterium]|nr:translocation protein TolB [Verrucomicrobiae bacterium]
MISLAFFAKPAIGQDWFRTSIGMDVNKPRVAIADFAPRADSAKSHAAAFTQVVRDDLQFSGILEVPSSSFYPPQAPSVPAELKFAIWTDPPTNANFVGFGNVSESTAEVAIEAWLFDVRSVSMQPVVGKVYRGAPTDAEVRKFAHQFADEILGKLSGGLPGVASTQIAFVSARNGAKEIWMMDYDGANQRPLTSLRTISLTPRWSPDASRIAFTCFMPANGL